MLATAALLFAVPSFCQQACVDSTRGTQSMHQAPLVILNDLGQEVMITALIADDGFERASGFQFICATVIEQTFILFKYPNAIKARFHMQNVTAPLDIAFFDQDGALIQQMLMKTYTETSKPIYGPDQPFQYALEARPGFFEVNSIKTVKSRLKMVE
jgi:uncharacterized membrane protein (UPF0127 family)